MQFVATSASSPACAWMPSCSTCRHQSTRGGGGHPRKANLTKSSPLSLRIAGCLGSAAALACGTAGPTALSRSLQEPRCGIAAASIRCRSVGSWSAIRPANSTRKPSWRPTSTLIHATSSPGSSVAGRSVRAHLGVETQRQWSDKAILRTTPLLLGLYSLVILWTHDLAKARKLKPRVTAWYPKQILTLSDAIAAVRREIWAHQISFMSRPARDTIEIPRSIWQRMQNALAYAA